jgi:hypothetical protein
MFHSRNILNKLLNLHFLATKNLVIQSPQHSNRQVYQDQFHTPHLVVLPVVFLNNLLLCLIIQAIHSCLNLLQVASQDISRSSRLQDSHNIKEFLILVFRKVLLHLPCLPTMPSKRPINKLISPAGQMQRPRPFVQLHNHLRYMHRHHNSMAHPNPLQVYCQCIVPSRL